MLITELRDAYREANKSFDFSLQLEGMKDEARIKSPYQINLNARQHPENTNIYNF